ncbi:MAG: leucine-rich repeat domain-containing protein [Clostridia bacterium]|nr:leucine-rich repeat domain-containing protein [Clostridia bacterium]
MKRHRCLYLLTALLLTVVLCLSPLNVFAADAPPVAESSAPAQILHEGTCGEDMKWMLDADGTFTLSGTGHMLHYTGPGSGDAPWLKYHDQIRAVVIGEGVTGIGNYAFFGCENLQSVLLPQSLNAICNYAFFGCTSLKEIIFPDRLQAIRDYAFAGCGLESVTLPASLTELGRSAFRSNTALRTAMLMGVLEHISDAFDYCSALTDVYLSSAVRYIASFDGCKSLRNVYYTGTTTQWYEIKLPIDNSDPLHKAKITFRYRLPSDIIDSSGISAAFYTTVPFTALRTGERRDLLVRLYKDGTLLLPSDELLLNTLSPGIVAHETRPDGWQFTFEADLDTWPDVEFYIPGTYFTTSNGFYIHNGTHTFHCGDPWIPESTRSTLQMDNFRCETSGLSEHTIRFDAYNTAYSWGVIITDSGVSSPEILPVPSKINDGSDIIVDGQRYMAVHTDASASATGIPVQLSLLGGTQMVTYTADGADSPYPALLTAIHIFTRWAIAEAGIDLSGEELQAVSLSMMNWVLDAHIRETAGQYGQRLHTLLSDGSTTHDLLGEVYALYMDLGVDVRAALRLGLVEQRPGLASQTLALPAAAPSADALAAALIRDPELNWPAMDYAFNLHRGSTCISVGPHTTDALEVMGNALRITSDRPFDRFTTLESVPSVPATGLSDALTNGLTDSVLYTVRLRIRGEEYNPATAFELPHRTLRVVLELPESLMGRSCAIYRINDDGTRTFVHADIHGRTAAFETDCTGTYLVGALTSEHSMPDVLIVVLAVLLGISFLFYRKKYPRIKENEDE